MMRSLCAFLVLASASLAFAYPNEGDKVEYVGTIDDGLPTPKSVTSKFEIYEYLPEQKEFLVRQETTVNGAYQAITTFMSEDDFLTQEVVQESLKNCQKFGGKKVTLTVPAGKFQTCQLTFEDDESTGTTWIADVPFGTAQSDITSKVDGSRAILKLKSASFGSR